MLNRLAKLALSYTPYRVVRGAINRFQGIEDCLQKLSDLGLSPERIIDGGAHLGSFAVAAAEIFPDAHIHMIEPQPACTQALERLAAERGFTFHPCALSAAQGTVKFSAVNNEPSTGSFIVWEGQHADGTVDVPTNTLDAMFAANTSRTLLKLDLQGHEMLALKGGRAMLQSVEVVITEASFFQQIGEPRIPELINFFDQAGFDLYDIAALSGRTRDGRLRQGDLVFIRRSNALVLDKDWA